MGLGWPRVDRGSPRPHVQGSTQVMLCLFSAQLTVRSSSHARQQNDIATNNLAVAAVHCTRSGNGETHSGGWIWFVAAPQPLPLSRATTTHLNRDQQQRRDQNTPISRFQIQTEKEKKWKLKHPPLLSIRTHSVRGEGKPIPKNKIIHLFNSKWDSMLNIKRGFFKPALVCNFIKIILRF